MSLSLQKKFAIFGVGPLLLLAMAGTAAFTFGQDVNTLTATQEKTDYLIPATPANTATDSYDVDSNSGSSPFDTYAHSEYMIYGELPQWFQVNSGSGAVPTAIQEPGDLLFINAASSTTNNDKNGGTQVEGNSVNAVKSIFVQGNITNITALRQTYSSCLIPIRLWQADAGAGNTGNASNTQINDAFAGRTTTGIGDWVDVTHTYLDTQVNTATVSASYVHGSHIATLTTSQLGFLPGDSITVADVRGVTDGTYSITSVSGNTITFTSAVGDANQALQTSPGTVVGNTAGDTSYNPYYIDCNTGTFSFTVPTGISNRGVSNDMQYEVTIERGGVFSTMNNNTGAVPEFVFQSTPIAFTP